MVDRVKYDEIRNLVKDGDVVFTSKRKTLVGWFIRLFTRSNYSHVGFAFWMHAAGQDRLMMVEAQGGAKRRIVNMSFYKDVDLDIMSAPKDWEEIGPAALEKLGLVEYGWLEAGYVGLREFLLKYLNIKIPEANLPGEICSEYVSRVLDLESQHISPQMLWEQLEKLGHKPRAFVRG